MKSESRKRRYVPSISRNITSRNNYFIICLFLNSIQKIYFSRFKSSMYILYITSYQYLDCIIIFIILTLQLLLQFWMLQRHRQNFWEIDGVEHFQLHQILQNNLQEFLKLSKMSKINLTIMYKPKCLNVYYSNTNIEWNLCNIERPYWYIIFGVVNWLWHWRRKYVC